MRKKLPLYVIIPYIGRSAEQFELDVGTRILDFI